MRYLSVLSFLFVAMLITSCKPNVLRGSGNKTTVNPSVTTFNALNVDQPLKLNITVQEGSQPAIQLSGYENVLNHIKTKVENNELIIYTDLDDTWSIDGDGIEVKITVPSLVGLTLKGAPDADIHGNVTGRILDVDISGASEIVADNINTDTFTIQVSGAGNLKVKGGSVKYAEYEINGAGEVDAFPLQSLETSATISGAGTSQVTATQKLTAQINGAGSIKYKGHPTVTQEVSGAGSIKDAN